MLFTLYYYADFYEGFKVMGFSVIFGFYHLLRENVVVAARLKKQAL